MASFPPPLPSARQGPPPLPMRSGISDPFALGSQLDRSRSEPGGFFSTRDVQRAAGSTYDRWVPFTSQALNAARFDIHRNPDGTTKSTGDLTIEYLSLARYLYKNRSVADWLDLIESSSKGRHNAYEIKRKWGGGIKLNGPLRKVTAKMLHARAPRGLRQAARTYTVGGRRGAFGAGGLPVR